LTCTTRPLYIPDVSDPEQLLTDVPSNSDIKFASIREAWRDGSRIDPTGLIRIFGLLTGAVLVLGLRYFQDNPGSPWYWHWAIGCALALCLLILSQVVVRRRQDEFERAISDRSAAISGRAMLLATVLAVVLEIRTGYPIRVPGESFDLESILFVGLMTEVLAFAYFRRRLRPE
jgi:membrane protein implicated in regulation of membrane protease activity